MRRGPNRQDRPPRVGAAVLAKALVGVFLIFVCTGVGVAGAGYFQFRADIRPPSPVPTPPPLEIQDEELPPPEPGGPRTLLVLGSDRRAKTRDRRQARAGAALGHDRARAPGSRSSTGSRCCRSRATSR